MITTPKPSSTPVLPPLLRIGDVAKILSASRMTVAALIESGELTAARVGPGKRRMKRVHLRVTLDSLAAFYKKRFDRDIHTALQNPIA